MGAVTLLHRSPEPEHDDATNESSPLLAGTGDNARDRTPSITPSEAPNHPKFLRVLLLTIVAVFVIEVGDYMQRTPFLRVLEDAVCRAHYEKYAQMGIDLSLPIPEADCKIPPVQTKLAMLKGWDMAFACIPSVLTAVPYGAIADKHGRKLVLILALLGTILSLCWVVLIGYYSNVIDIRWFWAGEIFLFIGGGSAMIKAMFFALLADVASEDKRASVFFQVMAAALIATVIGVPSASHLMKKNPFTPMILGIAFIALGMFICFFIPETLDRSKVSGLSPDACDDDGVEDHDRPPSAHRYSRKNKMSDMFEKMTGSRFLLRSPMLLALSVTFLLQSLSLQAQAFKLQLASTRFHWSLGNASFLVPIGAVTNFIILLVVLPAIYRVLSQKFQMGSMMRDLVIARGSLVFIVIGALIMAWGPIPGLYILGDIILSCGSGFSFAIRSLVTSLVHPDEVSRLYAVMAVVDNIGILISGPLLSKFYGWGAQLAGPWTGMAFITVAAMFLILGLPIWLVKDPTQEMDVHG